MSTDPRFGLVRTFRFVLWLRATDAADSWRALRSDDSRDVLEVHAMKYPSDRVRVLPMGERP